MLGVRPVSDLKARIDAYVLRVKEQARGKIDNEQTTKYALIDPLFKTLGYDVSNSRECILEYRENSARGRSKCPIDYAFCINDSVAFVVEAKSINEDLNKSRDQLAEYFARLPTAHLGILTNGVQWRFFADGEHQNIMDKEAFETWDVLTNVPPYDVIYDLERAAFSASAFRRRAIILAKIQKGVALTPHEKIHFLYDRNFLARNWPDSRVAEHLGLTKNQVKAAGAFRRNLAKRKGQELLDDEYTILTVLAAFGRRATVAEICQQVASAVRTVHRKIGALGDDGYVVGMVGDNGGYEITSEGRRALAQCTPTSARRGDFGFPAS